MHSIHRLHVPCNSHRSVKTVITAALRRFFTALHISPKLPFQTMWKTGPQERCEKANNLQLCNYVCVKHDKDFWPGLTDPFLDTKYPPTWIWPNNMNLTQLRKAVEDRRAWHALVHGSRRVRHDLTTKRRRRKQKHFMGSKFLLQSNLIIWLEDVLSSSSRHTPLFLFWQKNNPYLKLEDNGGGELRRAAQTSLVA